MAEGYRRGEEKTRKVKVKVFLYSAVSGPLDRSERFTLFPPLADLFIPTPFSASPGSILATLQLRAKTKSLTFPPLSIARYSFTAESTEA